MEQLSQPDHDQRHSWHPFTQMQEYLEWPRLEIVRGEGSWLFDDQNQKYLDTNASVWCNVHGHAHPELSKVISEQAGQLCHSTMLGLSNRPAADFSAALSRLTKHRLPRVFFSDNGSNAIEIALKLSLQYWQLNKQPNKQIILHLEDAYHGDTFGTMSVGGSEDFHGRFRKWCFDSPRIPHPERGIAKSIHFLEQHLQMHGHKTAAVIIEPFLQGAAGMKKVPLSFLQEVSSLCLKHNVHLIMDEVFVGFGRLGSMSPSIDADLAVDFICWGKGISAGYLPLAATMIKEELYQSFLGSFSAGRTFFHGHTFCGNPLAAAVSLRSLEMLEEKIASKQLEQTIEYFQKKCAASLSDISQVRAIRMEGLSAAIDLCPDKAKPHSFDPSKRTGWKVCIAAREHGLIVRPLLDSLLLVPPISITSKEIDFLFTQLNYTLKKVFD